MQCSFTLIFSDNFFVSLGHFPKISTTCLLHTLQGTIPPLLEISFCLQSKQLSSTYQFGTWKIHTLLDNNSTLTCLHAVLHLLPLSKSLQHRYHLSQWNQAARWRLSHWSQQRWNYSKTDYRSTTSRFLERAHLWHSPNSWQYAPHCFDDFQKHWNEWIMILCISLLKSHYMSVFSIYASTLTGTSDKATKDRFYDLWLMTYFVQLFAQSPTGQTHPTQWL